jgi:hypothetical protein
MRYVSVYLQEIVPLGSLLDNRIALSGRRGVGRKSERDSCSQKYGGRGNLSGSYGDRNRVGSENGLSRCHLDCAGADGRLGNCNCDSTG